MIVEPLSDENEWEEFVSASPNGTFFHTLKWKEVLEKSFDYESTYLEIRDSTDLLIGVCPFFITKRLWPFKVLDSLPHSDLGGPLFKEEFKKEAATALIDYLKKLDYYKHITYTKMKLLDPKSCECLRTDSTSVDCSTGTMILDLEEKTIDFIWNDVFTKKGGQRRVIRRFERDGFQSREARSIEDLNKFYGLYSKSINRIGGVLYPFKYFKNIWDLLYPDNFNIILVEKGENCIGASAFFIYKNKSVIYLCYAGYEQEILSNRYNYSYYARWREIEWANKNGFRYVSFGPTPSDPKSSYYLLKSGFGSEFNQNFVLYLPSNKELYFLRESFVKLGRMTKKSLPKILLMTIQKRL